MCIVTELRQGNILIKTAHPFSVNFYVCYIMIKTKECEFIVEHNKGVIIC